MYSFSEWLVKNHGVNPEDLKSETAFKGFPVAKAVSDKEESKKKPPVDTAAKKEIRRERTRGEGKNLYNRFRR